MNWPLFSVIASIATTVTVGVFMIGALVSGYDQISHILMVVLAGIVISIPIAWYYTRKIGSITGDEEGYAPLIEKLINEDNSTVS